MLIVLIKPDSIKRIAVFLEPELTIGTLGRWCALRKGVWDTHSPDRNPSRGAWSYNGHGCSRSLGIDTKDIAVVWDARKDVGNEKFFAFFGYRLGIRIARYDVSCIKHWMWKHIKCFDIPDDTRLLRLRRLNYLSGKLLRCGGVRMIQEISAPDLKG